MATLYKQHDTWWVNYSIGGKRYRISTGTKNHKLAKIKLEDLKLKVFKGEIGATKANISNTSVADLFKRFKNHCTNNYAPEYLQSDLSRIRYMQEYFAESR